MAKEIFILFCGISLQVVENSWFVELQISLFMLSRFKKVFFQSFFMWLMLWISYMLSRESFLSPSLPPSLLSNIFSQVQGLLSLSLFFMNQVLWHWLQQELTTHFVTQDCFHD